MKKGELSLLLKVKNRELSLLLISEERLKKTAKIMFMVLASWILAILCAWVVSAWAGPAPVKPARSEPDLVILFTHDLHSDFLPHHALCGEGKIETVGGYGAIAAAIKQERAR